MPMKLRVDSPHSIPKELLSPMLDRIKILTDAGQSFAFETTCSGRGHMRFLKQCRACGYRLTLLFLWLSSPRAAITRVARRVRQGGHNIPKDVIVRRYQGGLRNMRHVYLPLVDSAFVFDNSDDRGVLIAAREDGGPLVIHDMPTWKQIEEATS
jgi:predicted ABC-type ATPase